MTFLELQKRIVQTRKARSGVHNRTDYFDSADSNEDFYAAGECKIVCVKGLYKSTSVLAY